MVDPKKQERAKPAEARKEVKHTGSKEILAVIRIRGEINIKGDIKDTLDMLRLRRKHACVVIEKNASNLGMLQKVKDYSTWGEIDEGTLKLLIEKRAEMNPEDPKRTKPYFRLSPPRGGFERKGIKTSFQRGGALGYRGKDINNLIKRMI